LSTSNQTINCYCGDTTYKIVKILPYSDKKFSIHFGNAQIVKCLTCGLLRTSPTPILDMPEIYDELSISESHKQNIELWKIFSNEVIQKLLPFKRSGRLLDIGCNIGILVSIANDYGFHASGIDLNQAAVDFGKENFMVELAKQHLENIQGENLYDVIVMNHVIEHIPNLNDFTSHIRRLLKPDGIFLAVCPNAESGIAYTLDFLNKRKSGKGANWFWYGYLPEQHVWQFGPSSLKNVLVKCHFNVLKVSAGQNMHWGATESKGIRFVIMKFLWNLYALLGIGDNLFIFCSPNK
jgi:SAM-dependent methyltransferase